MRAVFGDGITRHFMDPYNHKVWATAPARWPRNWIAERVSVIDYERALANVRDGRDEVAWGPNNTFVFPAIGGTGEIYRRLAERYSDGSATARKSSRWIPGRAVRSRAASELAYDALVSTMPVDLLVGRAREPPQS